MKLNSLKSKLINTKKTRKKLLLGMLAIAMTFSSLLGSMTSIVHAQKNNQWEEIEKVLNKPEAESEASITDNVDTPPDGFQFNPTDDRLTFYIFHLSGDSNAFNNQAKKDWYIRLSRQRSLYEGKIYAELVDKTNNEVIERQVVNSGNKIEFNKIKQANIANFNYSIKLAEQKFDRDGKEITLYFVGMDSGMGGNTKGTVVYSLTGVDTKLRLNDWSGVMPIAPMEQTTKYLKKKDNSLLAKFTQTGGNYGDKFKAAGVAKFENYELIEEPTKKSGTMKKITPGTYTIDDRYDKKRARIKFNVKEDGTQRIAMLIINPDHPHFDDNYKNNVLDAKFLDLDRLQNIIMDSKISEEKKIDEFNKTNPNYLLMFISKEIPVGKFNEETIGSSGSGTWEYKVKTGTLRNNTKGKDATSITGYLGTLTEKDDYRFFTVEEFVLTRGEKKYSIGGLESGMQNKNESINTDVVYYYVPKGGVKVFFVNTKGEQIKAPVVVHQNADKDTKYNTADVKENIIPFGGKTYRFKAIDPIDGLKTASQPEAGDSRKVVEITEEKGTVETDTIKELTYVYEEVEQSLTVEKSVVENKYVKVGDVLHYTVIITNTGEAPYEALDIKDSLVDFANMKVTESKTKDNKLEVGENWILNYEYTVTEDDVKADKVVNKVTVKDPQKPNDPGEEGQTETPKEKVYKVTHEYVSGTPNKDLPQEVKNLTPKNQENKKNGEEVTPTPPEKTKVIVEDGEWVFENYDRETGRIENKDEHFVGTWVFKETPTPKTGNVYVKYITEDGDELEAEKPVKENTPVGEEYTTEKKHFAGYEFVKMEDGSAPEKGEVKEVDQHVVYVYKKVETPTPKTGNVYVKYITEDGQELESEKPVKEKAPVGEEYTTDKKNFNGYEFVKMKDGSAPQKGEVKEADQHVVYVYRKAKVNNDKPVIPYNNNNGGKIAGSLPKTGDSSDILLYSGTSIISLVALAIIAYKKRAESR